MREILPQAYDWYSEDKILSITQSLGEKIVLQVAQAININVFPIALVPSRDKWYHIVAYQLLGWKEKTEAAQPK